MDATMNRILPPPPELPASVTLWADHSCAACPIPVRDLYATAHNVVVEFERGVDMDFGRLNRRLTDLVESVHGFRPVVDAHFTETDLEGNLAREDALSDPAGRPHNTS
jgi:hypothetical protein